MTSFRARALRSLTCGFAMAVGLGLAPSSAYAQNAPVLLLLDQNAIAANQSPNLFGPTDINLTTAAVGVRDPLPYFIRHRGDAVTLPVGSSGHEGWFALSSVPSNWASEAGASDAPQNFLLAGAGLGSPDQSGSRMSLLGNIPDVRPLHVSELQALAGKSICAVAYAAEIPWGQAGTSLQGGTLGIVAFSIDSVNLSGGAAVSVTIRVLDADSTCHGSLALASF